MAATSLPILEQLWSEQGSLGPAADRLAAAYGGELAFPPPAADRPTVIVNFVSTLDGVVSYATAEAAGGGEISGFFEPDRFVMGLLRAHANAVLVGAGTVRAAPDERWTPDYIYPDAAADFAALRRAHGLQPQPTTVVLTRSAELDTAHPGLSAPDTPVLLAVADSARPHAPDLPSNIELLPTTGVDDLLRALHRRGVTLLLSEGGPHLLGQLLAAGAVDELFLTIAPQIAGRALPQARLALVEGMAFTAADAPWWRLVSVARAGEHLFLRYRARHSKED